MTFKVKTKGQIEGEKLLVPKLRFKEFKNEWNEISLKKLLSFKNGINGDKDSYGYGVKYISVGDILNNTYITYDKIKGLIDINDKTLKENSVEYGDMVFQRSSETFNDIGQANVYLDKKQIATFGGFVIRGKKIGNYNPLFFNYLLKSPCNRKKVIVKGAGAQHYNISQEELEKIKVNFTVEEEQVKIANLFYSLDQKIELQKQKIETLKIYKKGLIQKYFESKRGEKIKISEILEEVINKTTENNQYEVISSTKDGLFLQSEYFNRSIASDNNIGYKILKKNQIVLSPQNLWMGNINYNNKYEIGMVSPSYKIFNINKKFDKDYISNLLKTNKAIYYYTINSEQGASIVRRNLNIESFYEINFVIPDITEQNKKGKIINEISQKIEKEEKKYQKLDKLKKGLLQKMFI